MASASACDSTDSATRRSAYCVRTVGCLPMVAYFTGWVYAGSSPSLCPCRRYPTRSMTKSSWNCLRYAMASRVAARHASGSSAFTWMTGIPYPFARSLE